jgi:hypothetical protein
VTSFHHQPEAQHPKSSAIHKNAGRLPHLYPRKLPQHSLTGVSAKGQRRRASGST